MRLRPLHSECRLRGAPENGHGNPAQLEWRSSYNQMKGGDQDATINQ